MLHEKEPTGDEIEEGLQRKGFISWHSTVYDRQLRQPKCKQHYVCKGLDCRVSREGGDEPRVGHSTEPRGPQLKSSQLWKKDFI